jgi:hypothetical protein
VYNLFGGNNSGTGVPAGFIEGPMGNNRTTWCSVRIGSTDNDTCNGNETDLDLHMVPGTFSALKAAVSTAPGLGRTWTVTLRKGPVNNDGSLSQADTLLTCDITGTSNTCTSTVSVTMTASEVVNIQVRGNSNSLPKARVSFAMIFTPA